MHRKNGHRRNRGIEKKLPQVKKEIEDFLFGEEGKISKANISKIGVSLAVLGMMLVPDSAQAAHTSHASHSNTFVRPQGTIRGGHNSSTTHVDTHANHGNHSSGGWC